MIGFRCRTSSPGSKEPRQGLDVGADVGVVRTERLLVQLQGAAQPLLGFFIVAPRAVMGAERTGDVGYARVARSQGLLANRQRAQVQGLGLGKLSLLIETLPQVVERRGDLRVLRTDIFFHDRKRAPEYGLRFARPSLPG